MKTEMVESVKSIDAMNELLLSHNGYLVLSRERNPFAIIEGKTDESFVKTIMQACSEELAYSCERIIKAELFYYGYAIEFKVEMRDGLDICEYEIEGIFVPKY